MFRSIRWRLVISYVLVTLLTVTAVGVLTLSLVKRYVEQRVIEDLTANADSVASQAEPLMWPVRQLNTLRELARTSAFLGGVQVRILDGRQQVLVDSGSPSGVDQLMWLSPMEGLGLEHLDRSWIMVIPHSPRAELQPLRDFPFFNQLPGDVGWTVISRMVGVWGPRFTFEDQHEDNGVTFFQPDANAHTHEAPAQDAEAHRSAHVVMSPIGEADDPVGFVELSSGPDFGAEALATTRRAFLLAAGGAMFLAVIVGLLVSHGLTAPLRHLTATASRMSEDLSARAPVRGKDEIGQLAQQLNQMAERLEVSFAALTADRDALRRFIADASHELRTPITALKNFNELLREMAVGDPAAHDEFLAESAVQLDRLEWITKNLLDLSRLEAGLIALDLDEYDAGELIEACSSAFKSLAEEKRIAVSIDPPASSVLLRCDRTRVELALSNLLGNAFKFTSQGGQVEIGAAAIGERVQFWVQDDGPGIPTVDQPHIFERFYRGRAAGTEGSGLGLAIVRSVVQAHGGRVWVESEWGEGSRFVIELLREP